ncbi:MAG: hypothetical protein HQM09_20545 [Candidatus Riflebacteria bacterium]|nr:hypothetical protein [Candidatus Riflebacteria bacterium]
MQVTRCLHTGAIFVTLCLMASVTLLQLQQALSQPNAALKKRALAIIFNEAIVEAQDIVEEYIGRESQPELQVLGLKVLKKLRGFVQSSENVDIERLLSMLSHPDPEGRILALRALVGRRSPEIPRVVQQVCAEESSPEAISLITDLLKNNPDVGNLPLLLKFFDAPLEKTRMDALEGILNIIYGCLYPSVLKALLDPSAPMKMKAYQLISKISRNNLIDALDFMLSSENPEQSRLSGQLLPSFLGSDLLPLLTKHASHNDAETVGFCRRALHLMSLRGSGEAAALLEQMLQPSVAAESQTSEAAARKTSSTTGAKAPPGAKPGSEPKQSASERTTDLSRVFSPELAASISQFPYWLTGPLHQGITSLEPRFLLSRLREFYRRIGECLILTFLISYFNRGIRTQPIDRVCYRTLQTGIGKTDPVSFVRSIASAIPAPAGSGDLFPFIISQRAVNDLSDTLFEEMLTLQMGWDLIDEHPEEGERLFKPALSSIEKLAVSLSPILDNRLIVKFAGKDGLEIPDLWAPAPVPADPRALANFELAMNHPLLIDKSSSVGISLFPFLTYDLDRGLLQRVDPSEHDLWEFLVEGNILEAFLAFLKEKT